MLIWIRQRKLNVMENEIEWRSWVMSDRKVYLCSHQILVTVMVDLHVNCVRLPIVQVLLVSLRRRSPLGEWIGDWLQWWAIKRCTCVLAPDAVVNTQISKGPNKVFFFWHCTLLFFSIPFFKKMPLVEIVNNRQELVLKSIDIYVGYPFKIIKTILKKTIFNISL